MTPRLPAPARSVSAFVAAVLVLLSAAPAGAIEFASLRPHRDVEGRIGISFRLGDPLETRVEQSLSRGMPVTLALHAELWRRRNGWFDRVERSMDATVRLRRDVWANAWLLERAGLPAITVSSLDSLESALSGPFAMSFPRSDRLAPSASYFVVLSATVKPLSVEDAEEVEEALSGEVRGRQGSGFGALTALPRALFDTVRNIAGLGDARARAVSAEFSPDSLPDR
ncbi:MAG: DUF4390 domain-containing protein [Candidatus Eisenbacteria bacterium]|nr:DUF4390 domain-containing protein [Candidatus Eisenbacteria bacterium]